MSGYTEADHERAFDRVKADIERDAGKLDPSNPQPGIYYDVPRSDYDAVDAWNYSTLKIGARYTLRKMKAVKDALAKNPQKDKDCFRIGRAFEDRLWNPSALFDESKYYITPEGFSRAKTKQMANEIAKADAVEAAGGTVLTPEQRKQVESMWESMHANKAAYDMLMDPDAKRKVVVIGRLFGLRCKAEVDWIFPEYGRTADLKTTSRGLNNRSLRYAIYDYGYHIQAAFYHALLGVNGVAVNHHHLIFQDAAFPFECRHVIMPPSMIVEGVHAYQGVLLGIIDAQESGIWPSYNQDGPESLEDDVPDVGRVDDTDYDEETEIVF